MTLIIVWSFLLFVALIGLFFIVGFFAAIGPITKGIKHFLKKDFIPIIGARLNKKDQLVIPVGFAQTATADGLIN